jgi:iron complex transport system substrate-binding protein
MLKKLAVFCLVTMLFTGLLASCGKNPSSTTPASSTVITDQLDRTVTLATTAPQRIISLAPSNTEILYALGLGDRIAGVSQYSDYPPEATTKPSVGAYDTPNLEKILALNPDLVLATEAHQATLIPELESRGIPAIALSPQTLDEVIASITLIGKATGAVKEAAKLTASMQKRIKAVADKTAALTVDKKPGVFYVLWNDPLMTVGKGTFIDELITKAGGVNIFGDKPSYPTVSMENVLTANPQVIVAGSGMGEGEDLPFTFASTEPLLKDTDARKNGRVYSVNTDLTGRPGPRLVDALEQFFKIIHPELQP